MILNNRRLFVGSLELDGRIDRGYVLANGDRIEAVGWGELTVSGSVPVRVFHPDAVIRQGQFNAHSHPEQSIYVDMVDPAWDLGTWCRNTIYRYSPSLTPRQVRLACRRAFSRMALYGTSTVMVSFYLHNGRGNLYDREVIAAARDVGIRLIFGRMTYDVISKDAYEGKRRSQEGYYETAEDGEKYLRELMELEGPDVVVAPAVHSMHGSTEDAIVTALRVGYELNRPVQFHLSEDKGDVDISLNNYGCRPVEFLDSLVSSGKVPGLDKMIVSDCCWVDETERVLMADRGISAVLNPRMNDRVGVGFTDLPALVDSSIPLFLGTDGEASNDDLSLENERFFLKDRYDGVVSRSLIDEIGKGAFAFGDRKIGPLRPGRLCDFRVDDKDGNTVHLFVGASQVVRDGRLVKLDLESDVEVPLREEIEKMRETVEI